MAISYRRAGGTRYEVGDQSSVAVVDDIAVEEPLEIRIGNGRTVLRSIVLMRTPGSDLELAVGWLRGEGVVLLRNDIASVRACADPSLTPERRRNTVLVDLGPHAVERLASVSRSSDVTGACGVCGADSLDRVLQHIDPLTTEQGTPRRDADTGSDGTLTREALLTLTDRLGASQGGFARTGGLHGGAVSDVNGELLAVREDIGRHNAVDKVLGWALLNDVRPAALVVSSRASFEIVQKAASAGVRFVVTVSAPSSLAVELAQRAGITLLAFARAGRATAYSHPEQIN